MANELTIFTSAIMVLRCVPKPVLDGFSSLVIWRHWSPYSFLFLYFPPPPYHHSFTSGLPRLIELTFCSVTITLLSLFYGLIFFKTFYWYPYYIVLIFSSTIWGPWINCSQSMTEELVSKCRWLGWVSIPGCSPASLTEGLTASSMGCVGHTYGQASLRACKQRTTGQTAGPAHIAPGLWDTD